jgi:metal-dependent amidase/aminoacylase/carboxypeptidase family protein
VTPIYINVGKLAFGTSAGEGVVGMTLRAHEDDVMAALVAHAERIARALASAHELTADVSWTEVFEAVVNDNASVDLVASVAGELGLDVRSVPIPFPWSEDFGVFTSRYPGAIFGLGSGTDHPPLHSRHYDFPDELLEPGVRLFDGIVRRVLGG